jgi:Tol biopolymer transport system component
LGFGSYGHRLRGAVVFSLAALAALVGAAATYAAFPGENGKIAFNCGGRICTINPDGTGLTTITSPPFTDVGDRYPAWSADGRKIAFAREFSCDLPFCSAITDDVMVMNADGSALANLTNSPNSDEIDPSWSPDSTEIAFASPQLGFCVRPEGCPPYDVYVMSADGTGVRKLTDHSAVGGNAAAPSWSTDGSELAFAAGFGLYGINPEGGGLTQLTNLDDDAPNWSPDGRRIAFFRASIHIGDPVPLTWAIYVAGADGTDQTKLTSGPFDVDPAWSPDGVKIAFYSVGPPAGIWIMNSDGTDPRFITAGSEPDWQPIPAPRPSDYRNAAKYCKAEREFFGNTAFANKYGGGANAYGKCVSGG